MKEREVERLQRVIESDKASELELTSQHAAVLELTRKLEADLRATQQKLGQVCVSVWGGGSWARCVYAGGGGPSLCV